MQYDKNFKCWGVSYGVVGDLIMGLPVLTYMEKKFPGSYKYWIIEKKVAFTAPLYLNHPLIDCIRITGEWSGFSREDYEIAATCEFKCTMDNWKHDEPDWYNRRGQIEETARIAGIYDLKEWLTEEELMPKLYKWWDDGSLDDNTIAIWPFAGRDAVELRSPSVTWWGELMREIENMGYNVAQFGHPKDMIIWPHVKRYNHLSYFEQVQKALTCKMSIGTDSGNMWVMGAYSHPGINLLTNWLFYHNNNMAALAPVNKNAINIFGQGSINNISHSDVLYGVERMMK